MAHPIPRSELATSLRTFAGYLEDLERVSFDGAATKLRLVVNYAQRERATHALWELLVQDLPSFEFLESVRDALTAPPQPRAAFAYAHQLLVHLKQGHKLNLREILTRSELSEGGGGLDARWSRFVQRFVAPYRARVEDLIAWLSERAGEERIEASDELTRALGATLGATSPAPNAPASVAPAPSPDPTSSSDESVDRALLALELRKHRPHPDRLAELRAALGEASFEDEGDDANDPDDEPETPHDESQEALDRGWEALEAARLQLAAERLAFEAEKRAFEAQRAAE